MFVDMKVWVIVKVHRNNVCYLWRGPEYLTWTPLISDAFRFKQSVKEKFGPEEILYLFDSNVTKLDDEEYYWHKVGDLLPTHSRTLSLEDSWILVSEDPEREIYKKFYYTGLHSGFSLIAGWNGWSSNRYKAKRFTHSEMCSRSIEDTIKMYGGIYRDVVDRDTEIFYWEKANRRSDWDAVNTDTVSETEKWTKTLRDLGEALIKHKTTFKVVDVMAGAKAIYFYCENKGICERLKIYGDVRKVPDAFHGQDVYRLEVFHRWRFDDVKIIMKHYEEAPVQILK